MHIGTPVEYTSPQPLVSTPLKIRINVLGFKFIDGT